MKSYCGIAEQSHTKFLYWRIASHEISKRLRDIGGWPATGRRGKMATTETKRDYTGMKVICGFLALIVVVLFVEPVVIHYASKWWEYWTR